MKNLFAALLLALFCLVSHLRADLTLVQKVDGLGQDMESTTKIKPGKIRVDASPATSIIMDTKAGDMISLLHTQKKYMRIPSQMAQAAIDSMKKMQADQAAATTPTPTGKKETIDGYPTEEFTCTSGGSKLTLWLTKSLPDYQEALKEMAGAFNQGPMSSMMKGLGVDFGTLPGFPMRITNELQPGQAITNTVESISTKPIPDSDFDLPADYQELKMPSLTPPQSATAPAVSK